MLTARSKAASQSGIRRRLTGQRLAIVAIV